MSPSPSLSAAETAKSKRFRGRGTPSGSTRPRPAGFRGVSEAVWESHVGGYQVCEKWLKDRKGRTLSKDDIAHYQKIVVALSETIRTTAEIDQVIGTHGGWPGAFATGGRSGGQRGTRRKPFCLAASPAAKGEAGDAVDGQDQPDAGIQAAAAIELIAREDNEGDSDSPPPVDELDRNEIQAVVREVFSSGAARDREEAIREVAEALGYRRVGANIREVLGDHLRTAVRRGIIANESRAAGDGLPRHRRLPA